MIKLQSKLYSEKRCVTVMDKKVKVPFKIWGIMISSVMLLGIGIFLFAQYKVEISSMRSDITERLRDTYYDIDYTYVQSNGEEKTISIYDFEIEGTDELLIDILEDKYGESWITIHKTLSVVLIVSGIILLIIFMVQYFKIEEGEQFVSLFKSPSIGIIIGALITWGGISMAGTSEAEAERSMRNHDGDPRFYGVLFLLIGIGIICFAIYILHKSVTRYMMAKNNPKEYEELLAKEKAQMIAQAQAHQRMLDAERDAAMNGNSGAPWETSYLPHPCPYCRRYKVRYIKWEDKRASVYFWGGLSSKIGTHYICDNCKKTWE